MCLPICLTLSVRLTLTVNWPSPRSSSRQQQERLAHWHWGVCLLMKAAMMLFHQALTELSSLPSHRLYLSPFVHVQHVLAHDSRKVDNWQVSRKMMLREWWSMTAATASLSLVARATGHRWCTLRCLQRAYGQWYAAVVLSFAPTTCFFLLSIHCSLSPLSSPPSVFFKLFHVCPFCVHFADWLFVGQCLR